jgi:hypothetical protein
LGFGTRAGSLGINTYLVLPYLKAGGKQKMNHLTDAELKLLIDDIIIPSIRSIYSTYILQHHPKSWENIHNKSKVKHEAFLFSKNAAIDLRYTLPEYRLGRLWEKIRYLCNNGPHSHLFRNAFLIVIGHNLKMSINSEIENQVSDIVHLTKSELENCFYFNEDMFPFESVWIDWAEEIIPRPKKGYILVLKSDCILQLAATFEDPTSTRSLTKAT